MVSYAKTVEPIEMPFGIWTWVGPSKHVLGRSAHWRHLANTIEPSMCSGNAACCQITLTTCYFISGYLSEHFLFSVSSDSVSNNKTKMCT